jgi:hypothetical protein
VTIATVFVSLRWFTTASLQFFNDPWCHILTDSIKCFLQVILILTLVDVTFAITIVIDFCDTRVPIGSVVYHFEPSIMEISVRKSHDAKKVLIQAHVSLDSHYMPYWKRLILDWHNHNPMRVVISISDNSIPIFAIQKTKEPKIFTFRIFTISKVVIIINAICWMLYLI